MDMQCSQIEISALFGLEWVHFWPYNGGIFTGGVTICCFINSMHMYFNH